MATYTEHYAAPDGIFHAMGSSQSGLALFTDLYELRMLQAYFAEGLTDKAVFSLFVRRLPSRRNFLLACGLNDVLDYLETLRFTDEDLDYLKFLKTFSDDFLDRLRAFRFRGDVYAVPEGTPIFANEPILEIEAELPQAQIVETLVMNQVHLQTLLASKAHRVVAAAQGRPVIDFGARRMHGIDAALKAARAFHIAGVYATSNVLAGKRWGLKVSGTMAHSYIQAHDRESHAFEAFARLYPDTILLVDTYNTLDGVQKVIDLAKRLGKAFNVNAVRLDSGNLVDLSKKARRMLNDAGLERVGIFVSGGLEEDRVARLLSSGAPIDGFGIGTRMGVSRDVPDLDIAYKLCEYAGKGRLKLSTGKPVLPGRKQIFRVEGEGEDGYDIIGRTDEDPGGRPLLMPVMRSGKRLPAGDVALEAIRIHAQQEISRLPGRIRSIEPVRPRYRVEVSRRLDLLHQNLKNEVNSI